MPRKPRRLRPSPSRTPSAKRHRCPFHVGSLVEVRSRKIGFEGAWFEATITSILPRRRGFMVSYSSLIADGVSSNTLKERVILSLVRPRQPSADPNAVFGFHQCVYAFQNDGWWRGVVSKLPEVGGDGFYWVCFPATREELRFKAADIRRWMEWVNGEWIVGEDDDQEEVQAMFTEGSCVEVSCDRGKYGAAWFAGTVLKVIAKTIFLVNYENLRSDGDNSSEMLLKEIVDEQYLRPCPPVLASTSFNMLDKVEGFHKNGWFAGVVSVILSGSRYIIKYKHGEEEMFDHASLRPCLEWTHGNWVNVSRGRQSLTPRGTKSAVHRQYSDDRKRSRYPVSVSMSSPDDVDVDISDPSIVNRKQSPGQHEAVEASQFSKKLKKAVLVEESLRLVNGMSRDLQSTSLLTEACHGQVSSNLNGTNEPVITMKKSSDLGERSEHKKKEANFVRVPVEHEAADNVPTAGLGVGSEGSHTPENTRKRRKQLVTRTPRCLVKTSDVEEMEEREAGCETLATEENSPGNDGISLANKQAVIMEDAHVTLQRESFVLIAESFEYSAVQHSSMLKPSLGRSEEISSCANMLVMNDRAHNHGELLPSGSLTDNIEMEMAPIDPPHTGPSLSEDDVCNEDVFSPTRLLSEEAFAEVEDRCHIDPRPCGSSVAGEDVAADHNELTPSTPIPVRPIETEWDQCDHQPYGSVHSNEDARDRERFPSAFPSGMSSSIDNKIRSEREKPALLACFNHNSSHHDEFASTGRQSCLDFLKDGALVDPFPIELSPRESESPFRKKSDLWELVESGEVFRVLPQEPHFRPLLQFHEEFREGMAIGLMVTFADIVNNISRMHIVDSQHNFEEKLRALGFLEANGFNVQPVHARITKLLELRGMSSQWEDKKHSLRAKLLELKEKNDESNLLKFSVERVISEMEQRISRLREKRAATMLEISRNESKIANLKIGVLEAEEAGVSTESLFSAALTAPW